MAFGFFATGMIALDTAGFVAFDFGAAFFATVFFTGADFLATIFFVAFTFDAAGLVVFLFFLTTAFFATVFFAFGADFFFPFGDDVVTVFFFVVAILSSFL